MPLTRPLLAAALLTASLGSPASPGVDLTDPARHPHYAGWTLLGGASAHDFTPGNGFTYSVLNLTTAAAGGQSGAGWAPQALSLDFNQAFSFRFLFNLQNDPAGIRGDGLTFVLADAPGLGQAGSGLGYEGLSGASVALAVDTFQFDGEPLSPSLQLLSSGSTAPLAATETGLGDSIRNANFAWFAMLAYTPSGNDDNAGTLTATIDNVDHGSFSASAGVDFAALGLAGVPVHYGFTAANGAATDAHTIQWGAPEPVPEPATWALILAGLAFVAVKARRAR